MDIDNVLNELGYDNLQAYIEDNPTGELNVVLHRIFSHIGRKKKRRNIRLLYTLQHTEIILYNDENTERDIIIINND